MRSRREGAGVIRELIRSVSWLGAANVVVKPLWFFFMTVMCARTLGASGYGIMTTAISLGGLGSLLTDLGTSRFSVREVSRDRSQASTYFSNFLALRLGLSLAAFGATMAWGSAIGYSGSTFIALVFASIYSLMLSLTDYSRSFFQSFQRLDLDGLSIVLEKLLVVGIGAAVLMRSQDVAWTLAGMALGMTMTAWLSMYWVSHKFAHFQRSIITWAFVRQKLFLALPLGLTGTFAAIYYRTDTVMIAAYLGDIPAGQYGLAFRVMDALNLLPVIVSFSVLFPRLSHAWHAGLGFEFRRLILIGLAGLALSSLLLAALLATFAADIVPALTADPSYDPAISALRILAWTYPFNCLHSLLSVTLVAVDELRYLAWATFLSVVLNIGLNVYLIPGMGIDGAAYTTMLSAAFLLVAYGWRCVKYIYSSTPTA